MAFIASPTNSFIMQHAPREQVGSIGGMIALTRNAGMVLGAALGLSGMMDQEKIIPAESFQQSFQINVWICIGAVILLSCNSYSKMVQNKKRNSADQQNNAKERNFL
ncbi:MFS transporter [Niallia nealsonii]|uniref:Uncharacterized protein n=1 Tax=Niallia nealsonii TaxID=115979 RepID=A0A2N0Z2U6_9BACI|nr:hypothetical protein [Niallia nealsonii]PKG23835.1 hypothetical protein CWS01_10075 [Niallia nealsonii]